MIYSISLFYKNLKNKYLTKSKHNQNELNKNPVLNTYKDDIKADDYVVKEYEIVEKEILPEKMVCPDCGGITLVGLEFCDKCGGELINPDLL